MRQGWRVNGFGALLGESEQRFIPAIQGLRGLAALSVVVTHLYAMPYLANLMPPSFPQWAHLSLVTGGRGGRPHLPARTVTAANT